MSAERNKEVVRRWAEEVWGQGKEDLLEELLARDLADHNPVPGLSPGLEGHRQLLGMVLAAFAVDCKSRLLLADGDDVVTLNHNVMVHKGEFMGIPPTGKQVTLTGVLQQRGAMPGPA